MKKYLILYKPFLIFLIKFVFTYLILTLIYQNYLSKFENTNSAPDNFTLLVSEQSEWLVKKFGYEAKNYTLLNEPFTRFVIDDKYVARIVEGCNALSVMILFVAFVVAFRGKFFQTMLFVSLGLIFIHFLNILRIALFVIGLRYFAAYKTIMHDIIFPLFIYGVVFLLWIIWVNKFSIHGTKK